MLIDGILTQSREAAKINKRIFAGCTQPPLHLSAFASKNFGVHPRLHHWRVDDVLGGVILHVQHPDDVAGGL